MHCLLKGYSKSCWTPRLRLSHSGQDKHAWNEVLVADCVCVELLYFTICSNLLIFQWATEGSSCAFLMQW
jgi:hypothetical protein